MLIKVFFWSIPCSLILAKKSPEVHVFHDDTGFDNVGRLPSYQAASWQNMVECPNQGKITGLQTKIEQVSNTNIDVTGLNGIKIKCDNLANPLTVFEGKWGEWGKMEDCGSGGPYPWQSAWIDKFQILYLPFRGGNRYHDEKYMKNPVGPLRDPQDDVGIASINRFKCKYNQYDHYYTSMSDNFNTWWKYEGYKFKPQDIRSHIHEGASCKAGGYICGLQVKNLPFQGGGGAQFNNVSIDDAAIIGLKIKCCFP